MVLHSDNHLLVHREPSCLPHGREDDNAYRERRGSRWPNGHCVWHPGQREYHDILQGNALGNFLHPSSVYSALESYEFPEGLDDRDVQEDVAVHGEQEAVGVRAHLRRGDSEGSSGRLRFPHGVDHARLHRAEGL